MEHKGKLELTWVGKYDDRVIEPVFLMEIEKIIWRPSKRKYADPWR